ncbi:acyl-[acyl-carrier-protein] thioesterase [Bacteroidota bacterium]
MENTLHCKYRILSYHINPRGKARFTSISNFLQETAYRHASSLGFGYHDLLKVNKAWILSRMRIRMNEVPNWDDELTIETWPSGVEKLFGLRDFRIFNLSGEQIGEASTCWLMVDTYTHRPLRIPPDIFNIKTRTDSVFASTLEKINVPEELNSCMLREVRYSDLDIVAHVNNVKFIEWCTDALSPELLLEHSVTEIEINYISEAKLGDKVEIFTSPLDDKTFYITGKNIISGKECFRAKVIC